jgi:hypothetical protein
MKRPSDALREIIINNLEQSRSNSKFIYEQADKLMVWIVGFSIGGLSIIITNITDLNCIIGYLNSKIILLLLSISIINGIIFRIAFFIYQNILNQIDIFINTSFSNIEQMDTDAQDLSNVNDIDEIILRLKVDFGENLSSELERYKNMDNENKILIINELKNHHKKFREFSKQDYHLAINYVRDTIQKAYKISPREIDKIFNGEYDGNHKFWGYVTFVCFLFSCISFIIVILILSISYI